MKINIPLDPVTARKLASSAIERARARDVLSSNDRVLFSWRYVALGLAGGLWGWLIAEFVASAAPLIGIVAGSAFFVALGAYSETLRMNRRLEAVVTLVLTAQDKT